MSAHTRRPSWSTAATFFLASSAAAQEAPPLPGGTPPAATAPASVSPRVPAPAGPEANSGFQLHVGLGFTRPFGSISGQDGAATGISPGQFLFFDLGFGGKIGQHVYIGTYLAGAGGPSGSLGCGSGCSSASVHMGIEAAYSFMPAETWNPWVGYGLGVDAGVVDTDHGSLSFTGFEFARLTAGLDARASRAFGIGPYLGLSFARYTDASLKSGGIDVSRNVEQRTVHAWFTLGLRFVVFP